MRVKSPFRLAVSILILIILIYTGYRGAVSLITGEPISFGIFRSGGLRRSAAVQDFVVAGTDKDGVRTDLILLCRYNLKDNSISALQIPRDTKVENSRYDKKINSAYGTERKEEALYDELEQITGIRPEKYVIVSFKAFRELIDSIGGVEMNVPMRMYYTDPVQNLTIDLYPGEQLLDGRKAEMFMRFRMNNDGSGYKGGDIERIAAQQTFYSAAMDKLISGKTILKAPKILSIISENVRTDFEASEIVKYIGRIPKFSMDKVTIEALPGEARYENGVSYFICDKEKTEELVKARFGDGGSSEERQTVAPLKNKFIKVRVVDATGIGEGKVDAAALVAENLAEYGFQVVKAEKAERIRDKSALVNHNGKRPSKELLKVYKNVEEFDEIEVYNAADGETPPDVTLFVGGDFSF